MSIQSQLRRKAKQQKTEKLRMQKLRMNDIKTQPLARLTNANGELLAGIVFKNDLYILGMDGKIAGSSHSAAHVFALIKAAEAFHQQKNIFVTLEVSDKLINAANLEAEQAGLTLDVFQQKVIKSLTLTTV